MKFPEIGWCGMDWIHLAQARDQWQALVDVVMNLLMASQEGFSCMELVG
jgi:hypothetical protein